MYTFTQKSIHSYTHCAEKHGYTYIFTQKSYIYDV